jgi:hypothetical protein
VEGRRSKITATLVLCGCAHNVGRMHIFLDESGSFGGIDAGSPALSAQGALILGTSRLPRISQKYQKLRLRLPKRNGEVKGSLLDEDEVAAVIELLRKNGAIFCASIIDMADHTKDDVAKHRDKGVQSLGANLTEGHTAELRAGVADLQRRMAGFSDPLYCQMMVTIDLLHGVMEEMITYHCQRNAKELAEFHWVVDAKNPGLVTDWEDWWSKTLVVWLQAISLKRPGRLIPGGDYRHFQRFLMGEIPNYLKEHAPETNPGPGAGIDLQLMFQESFRFSADVEPGLELVDITTNALRRALVGNLREEGWLPLRSLMIHRSDFYVRPVSMLFQDRRLSRPYSKMLSRFRSGGRNMATRSLSWPDDEAAVPALGPLRMG